MKKWHVPGKFARLTSEGDAIVARDDEPGVLRLIRLNLLAGGETRAVAEASLACLGVWHFGLFRGHDGEILVMRSRDPKSPNRNFVDCRITLWRSLVETRCCLDDETHVETTLPSAAQFAINPRRNAEIEWVSRDRSEDRYPDHHPNSLRAWDRALRLRYRVDCDAIDFHWIREALVVTTPKEVRFFGVGQSAFELLRVFDSDTSTHRLVSSAVPYSMYSPSSTKWIASDFGSRLRISEQPNGGANFCVWDLTAEEGARLSGRIEDTLHKLWFLTADFFVTDDGPHLNYEGTDDDGNPKRARLLLRDVARKWNYSRDCTQIGKTFFSVTTDQSGCVIDRWDPCAAPKTLRSAALEAYGREILKAFPDAFLRDEFARTISKLLWNRSWIEFESRTNES